MKFSYVSYGMYYMNPMKNKEIIYYLIIIIKI